MMNFETLLTNQEKYNYHELSTVTERCFWHWATKVGIIKQQEFSDLELSNKSKIYAQNKVDGDPEIMDDTVLKCFGAIDAGNSLSTEFGMYNETYLTIPTSYGSGPVYLRQRPDDNYKLGCKYTSSA